MNVVVECHVETVAVVALVLDTTPVTLASRRSKFCPSDSEPLVSVACSTLTLEQPASDESGTAPPPSTDRRVGESIQSVQRPATEITGGRVPSPSRGSLKNTHCLQGVASNRMTDTT